MHPRNNISIMKLLVFDCLVVTMMAYSETAEENVIDNPPFRFLHPYKVSLQTQQDRGWQHICSGTIIARNKALTAAHCLQGQSASMMRMEVGAVSLYEAHGAKRQTVGISHFVAHENYESNAAGISNDIGVVYTKTPLTLNTNVQVAGLAPKDSSIASSKCIATCWGQSSGTESGSTHLQQANITTISTAECQSRWPGQNITNKHICVYESDAVSGSQPTDCTGDSGGPLMCGNNLDLLTGINSWGVSNCSDNYPRVYTRVSEYRDWIERKQDQD